MLRGLSVPRSNDFSRALFCLKRARLKSLLRVWHSALRLLHAPRTPPAATHHVHTYTPPHLHTATLTVRTYDGDTPQSQRAAIRKAGGVVISNPDMLHTGILPHHPRWADLFANLKYVVLDEVHTYVGMHGAQVALLLRRWRNATRKPITFVGLSATLRDSERFFAALTGLPANAVDRVERRDDDMLDEGRE